MDKPIDKPAPAPTQRAEPREVVELRQLKSDQPDLASAIDLQIQLLNMQRRVQVRVPLPSMSLDAAHLEKALSAGTPIVVGDKIFLTSEVSDLVCLDKQSGRVLWLRSSPEFEALSEADRNTNSAYAEKLVPLAAELAKANAEAVTVLNARLATATTDALRALEPALKRKRELEKQISDAQLAIDKKAFARYWGQAVFGFAGPLSPQRGEGRGEG